MSKYSTRAEGSRHHAGGRRPTIMLPAMSKDELAEFIEKVRREEGDEFAGWKRSGRSWPVTRPRRRKGETDMKTKLHNFRTWQRAKHEATSIRVRYHESEGVTWLIHRGWLAGFNAGAAAALKREKRSRKGTVRR